MSTNMLANMQPLYKTKLGSAFVVDSLKALALFDDESIDVVITSPPFALQRQKSYGNVAEHDYVDWLLPFGKEIYRVLKSTGSFVLDLGGAYRPKSPTRSLYNFRVLLALCDEVGFRLAEDFYWFNPAKLPSPIEWVNKRKIRAKDSVNTVWWLSKGDFPKANVRNVLVPYSDRMKKLLADPESFYQPKKRPSGHDIGSKFGNDNGGAIPTNLLTIPNTDSNSTYLRLCKHFKLERHPARFPEELPRFFIKMLTEPDDLVVDVFAGSNTTGAVAEALGRRWVALESSHEYLQTSIFRFVPQGDLSRIARIVEELADPQAALQLEDSFMV